MTDLATLTIAQSRKGLRNKEFTSRELTEAFLNSIALANSTLNAYVAVTGDLARTMAKASDERIKKGDAGALEGIPLGIKDLFATKGVHTQACSRILTGFKPPYESTVTANLWAQGAVMLGKLNMDEFAMGSSNETSCYGGVINPWRKKRARIRIWSPAAPPAAPLRLSLLICARGRSLPIPAGSIRQPAAFTGTVGIKPTYGRCSRWGISAFASSLDQAGPIARTVQDSAILLKSMASVDPKDTTSVNIDVPDYEAAIGKSIRGLKRGIPPEYRVDGMPGEIEELWQKGTDWLKSAGAEIIDIAMPHTKYALPAYYIVALAEASSNLARYDGVRYGLRVPGEDLLEMYENTRAEGFGAEVKRRILIGTYVLSAGYYDAYYLRAQKVRTLIKRDFDLAWQNGVDVILTPTTPVLPFAPGEITDPVAMYLNDIFTVTVNMAGLPSMSVPSALNKDGLPLGLQLIGRPFDESTLFQVGHVIEDNAGHFKPAIWW